MALNALASQILEKITPKPDEIREVNELSQKLQQRIEEACKSEGIPAKVRVEGSVAKDTWLKENPDIDIFIRLPISIPRKNLGEIGLRIAKKAAGDMEQVERFAEHPYLEIVVGNYSVDVVPCYDAAPGEWKSATDRTPYHTDYIRKNLKKDLQNEIRLLKKFLQGIGVYGAEIKVGGFSGYLCELLVMNYGSFAKVIDSFAAYNKRVVIDIEDFYAEREKDIGLLFPEPLVIIDPVDRGRNVASAAQTQKLYEFIAAARAFQNLPKEEFFYPPRIHALAPTQLECHLGRCGSSFLFLVIGEIATVPDVLWGQLYRTKRSLRTLLECYDYKVLRDTVWSDEKALSVLVYELEQAILPNIKKHFGPQLERETESKKFLDKYVSDERVFAGPYIDSGRWTVELPRKSIDAKALFREKLADGGKNAGVAELVTKAIELDLKVFVNAEILKLYTENSEFAVFLTGFVRGKPFWLT